MYEVLFCFCILLHWRVFLPLVESSCQIWFPMLTFAFLSLPLLRKTDVKIRKQTEKRETKRKQETVFYVFLRMSLANIGKFKLSLKALILSVFTFICFLVFSNVFCRTKIFLPSNSCAAIFYAVRQFYAMAIFFMGRLDTYGVVQKLWGVAASLFAKQIICVSSQVL